MDRILLPVVLLLAAAAAQPAPMGLAIALEAGATDLLEAEDEIEVFGRAEVSYAIGATGLTVGVGWEVPVVPEVTAGTVELRQEFATALAGVALTVENTVGLTIEDGEWEGDLSVLGEHVAGPFTAALEVAFTYAPEVLVDLVPGLSFETDIGPGALSLGAEQVIAMVDTPAIGETVLSIGYELDLRGGAIALEIQPIVTEARRFTAEGRVTLERFF